MPNEKKNINIGFIINYRLDGWLGVTNYYLNLFNTIKSFSKKRNDKQRHMWRYHKKRSPQCNQK